MRLELRRVERRFATAHATAHGTLHTRELVEVALFAERGLVGVGEAAPLESYDGVSIDRVLAALGRHRTALARGTPRDGTTLLDACRAADELPQALAAIDMALWDLAGKRTGAPVSALLCERPAERIAVNASIAALEPAAAAAAARDAVLAGYGTVKLKVGVPGDSERVAAVRRAIGPRVSLRLDANGAWGLDEATRALEELAGEGIELVEEPVRGLHDTRALRERVAVRIAIDETAALAGALTARVADAVSLKITRCGGIGGLLAAAALVRVSGAEVYLSSTYDGPRGIAAALHAAAALAPLPACGLATLGLFAGEPSPFPVERGHIAVPRGPGLGV